MLLNIFSYEYAKTDARKAKWGYLAMIGLLKFLDFGYFCSQSAANAYQYMLIKLM